MPCRHKHVYLDLAAHEDAHVVASFAINERHLREAAQSSVSHCMQRTVNEELTPMQSLHAKHGQ